MRGTYYFDKTGFFIQEMVGGKNFFGDSNI
jgi:hypothetical protein